MSRSPLSTAYTSVSLSRVKDPGPDKEGEKRRKSGIDFRRAIYVSRRRYRRPAAPPRHVSLSFALILSCRSWCHHVDHQTYPRENCMERINGLCSARFLLNAVNLKSYICALIRIGSWLSWLYNKSTSLVVTYSLTRRIGLRTFEK